MKFNDAFRELTGHEPFPWQQALYERFISSRADNIPSSCNLPTGLGKTSVIAVWLLARQVNRSLPCRLVYVVNRRTVVDQTTEEVKQYKKQRPDLAVSTLRGEFVDNREWSADPSREAVICGTVDMIGSRLLFSGYGLGFRSKPLHAGFLGQDTLIVHDEAHLEPAFQRLLLAIQKEQQFGRFPDRYPLRVMELTATSRGEGEVFELTEEEKHPDFKRADVAKPLRVVWERTHAKKTIRLHEERSELADELAELARAYESSGCAILVFVRSVDDLRTILSILPKEQTQPLTGTMRGFERDDLFRDPVFVRFLPKSSRPVDILPAEGTVYLVCTSAGEVGVNISADHLVCDLSTFESMAQRFGRVNRFGLCDDTHIDIVYPASFDDKDPPTAAARRKTLKLLKSLKDASPAALAELNSEDRLDAFAPSPDTVETSDILFDAWSMTSVRGEMPGRPEVEPYLRGVHDWEPPQTKVGWRSEVAEISGELLEEYPAGDLLEVYPIKSHELLADQSDRVFKTLKRLVPNGDPAIWIVDDDGNVEVTSWKRIIEGDKEDIQGVILLLSPQLGGLDKRGFFTASAGLDEGVSYDISEKWKIDGKLVRARSWWNGEGIAPLVPDKMKTVARITTNNDNDEEDEPPRMWYWFVRIDAAEPDTRSNKSYPLQPHLNDAREAADRIVAGLPLEPEVRDAVILAAACHDLGKDRERWQSSVGNRDYPEVKWAKSGGRTADERLSYRHEFGSLLDVRDEARFCQFSDDAKDLVLHLIAAHHGRARPHFNSRERLDDKYSLEAIRDFSTEVPRRFARLQRKFGRWGLAYLESLVRCADYEASIKAGIGKK